MAFLSQKGLRTVYCPDVITYEEVPSNYLGMRLRDKRWIKGNFQTFPLFTAKDLSMGARFYIFYGLYMYITQPIFLSWIILSLIGNSLLFGQFLLFQNIKWVPMKKDPFESLTMKKTIQTLWPSTILGVVLINFGINNSPYGTFFALPILTSFALSIPVAYATSLPWPLRISDNSMNRYALSA